MARKNLNSFAPMEIIASLFLIIFLVPGVAWAGADRQKTAKRVFSSEDLFRLGEQKLFEGAALREIAFPLGGIGTGTISLGGRGNLRDCKGDKPVAVKSGEDLVLEISPGRRKE